MFVRGAVVVAVVDAVANIVLCNAAPIVAGELCVGVTWSKKTAHFVTVVSTVIVVVTAVVVGHTSAIATSEHCRFTGVEGTDSLQFIAAISTVVVIVTFPLGTNTAAIHTGELARLAASPIIRNTVLVVSQVPAAL